MALNMLACYMCRGQTSTALARAMYTCLIDNIGGQWLQRNHVQAFNGYGLWRRVYAKFRCSNQVMHDVMENRIRRVERCTDARQLEEHVAEYLDLLGQHGGSLTEDQTRKCCVPIFHMDFEEEYSDRGRYPTLQCFQDDILRLSEFHNGKRLVKEYTQQRGICNSRVNQLEEPSAVAGREPTARLTALEQSITSLAAIDSNFNKSPPTSPPTPTGEKPPRPSRPPCRTATGSKQLPDR